MTGRRAWAVGGLVFRALAVVAIALVAMALVSMARPADAMTFSAQRYLDRINAARAEAGLPALREDPELTALAEAWVGQQATTHSLARDPAHPPDITQGFSTPWLQVGDNIVRGADIDANWEQLRESTIHWGNITNAGYTQVGIGVAIAADGTEYVHQWFIEAEPVGIGAGGSGGTGGGGATPTGPAPADPLPAEPAEVGVLPDVVTGAVNAAVISSLEYGKAVIPSLSYGGASTTPTDADDSSLAPWLLALPLALLLVLLALLLARRTRRADHAG
jgi:hypothetical protein